MDINDLKAEIVRNGLTLKETARKMGLSYPTFIRRMRTQGFTIGEANLLIDILNIKNPEELFFGRKVTK